MSQNNAASANRISRTLVLSVLAMAVNYLISLILTSYITENLGAEAYGFVTLAKNISNYAIVFTSCLNAYSSRFITVSYHKGEKDRANTYFSSVFYANVLLSVVVLAVAAVGIVFVDKLLNIPSDMVRGVQILLLLDFLNYMLLSTGTCFTVYGYISDKLDLMNAIKFISYVADAVVLVVLYLCFKPSIVYVGLGLLASSVVFVSLNLFANKKSVPDLKLSTAFFKISAVKDLVLSGIWNSLNSIGNLLQSGLDLVVSNLMLSAIATGQISVVKTLSTIFTTLFQLLASPFQPKLLKQYSEKNINGVISTFNTSMKLTGFFSVLLFAGFSVLGKMYYKLWTPTQDISVLYALTMLTFLGSVIEGIVFPLFYTYTLTLKNKVPCFVTVLSGFLNVGGMYVLIKYFDMGLNAVVLTTTVLGWGTYFVFTPLYSAKCLGCSPKVFYPTIIRILSSGAVMTLCVSVLDFITLSTSWLALICWAVPVAGVCAIVYFICVFSKEERAKIMRIIPFLSKTK